MPVIKKARTKWGDRPRRRRDILEAARLLYERHGYDGLHMRSVAEGAGVSPGTLYTYFTDREALFAVLYAERLDRFAAEIAPQCADATSLEALLIQIANRYLDVYRVFGRELNLWTLLVAASVDQAEVAAPLVQSATNVMATVLGAVDRCARASGVELGRVRDGELLVPYFWATLNGLADHFTSKRHLLHRHSWDELVRFSARMLVAALSSLKPAPRRPRRRR
jgi:AcrR family transcriptional regulator